MTASVRTLTTRSVVRAELPTGRAGRVLVGPLGLAVVVAAGLWRALPGLASASLNYDESFGVRLARGSWSDLGAVAVAREPWLVVHDLVLRLWGGVFGWSASSVRLLSIAAFVVTIVLVYRLGVRLFGTRTGLSAAAVVALHGTTVAQAREATGGALATALVCAAVLTLLAVADGRSSSHVAAVAVVVAGWASPFGGPAVVSAAVALAVASPSCRPALRRVTVAAVLGWLPLFVHLVTGAAASSGWVGAARAQQDAARSAAVALTGAAQFWAAAGVLAAVVVASLGWWRRRVLAEWVGEDVGLPVVTAWAFVPLSAAAAVSCFVPVLTPAEMGVSVPAVALALAAAVQLVWNVRLWAVTAASAIVVLIVVGDGFPSVAPADWRAAAAVLDTAGARGDVVVVIPAYDVHALAYAVDERGGVPPGPSVSVAASWSTIPVDTALDAAAVCGSACHALWVVSAEGSQGGLRVEPAGWTLAGTWQVPGLVVTRYLR